jgi:hypothetical protein
VVLRANQNKKNGYYIYSGLALGVTSLAHPAPPIYAALFILFLTVITLDKNNYKRTLCTLLSVLVIGSGISALWWGPNFIAYRFEVKNPLLFSPELIPTELTNLTWIDHLIYLFRIPFLFIAFILSIGLLLRNRKYFGGEKSQVIGPPIYLAFFFLASLLAYIIAYRASFIATGIFTTMCHYQSIPINLSYLLIMASIFSYVDHKIRVDSLYRRRVFSDAYRIASILFLTALVFTNPLYDYINPLYEGVIPDTQRYYKSVPHLESNVEYKPYTYGKNFQSFAKVIHNHTPHSAIILMTDNFATVIGPFLERKVVAYLEVYSPPFGKFSSSERVNDTDTIFNTTDLDLTFFLIKKYNITYIVRSWKELNDYDYRGLNKFENASLFTLISCPSWVGCLYQVTPLIPPPYGSMYPSLVSVDARWNDSFDTIEELALQNTSRSFNVSLSIEYDDKIEGNGSIKMVWSSTKEGPGLATVIKKLSCPIDFTDERIGLWIKGDERTQYFSLSLVDDAGKIAEIWQWNLIRIGAIKKWVFIEVSVGYRNIENAQHSLGRGNVTNITEIHFTGFTHGPNTTASIWLDGLTRRIEVISHKA